MGVYMLLFDRMFFLKSAQKLRKWRAAQGRSTCDMGAVAAAALAGATAAEAVATREKTAKATSEAAAAKVAAAGLPPHVNNAAEGETKVRETDGTDIGGSHFC